LALADLLCLSRLLPPGIVVTHLELEEVGLSGHVVTSSDDSASTLPGLGLFAGSSESGG